MADTPIPEGLTEAVANVYNAMEFDDLELQEMVMLAIAQGILAERAAQAERIRELEEALRRERDRIADALDEEADMLPCAEDAMVTRSNARLVRANFSYEEVERLEDEDAARSALGGNNG